jgi:serine/threonine protein kinase
MVEEFLINFDTFTFENLRFSNNSREKLEQDLSYFLEKQLFISNKTHLDRCLKGIVELLGGGSFGNALRIEYKCVNFTIKRIKLSGERGIDLRSLEEMDKLRQLFHPNLISYYNNFLEFDELHKPWLNLLMDSSEMTLEKWLENAANYEHDLSKNSHDSLKIWMFLDICKGLTYIHQNCFIHGDLNPANIVLDGNSTCKISDYGLLSLKKLQGSNNLRSIAQTNLIYAAPENFNGNFNHRGNIFSLGLIYFQFLANFHIPSEKTNAFNNAREVDLMSLCYNRAEVRKVPFLPQIFQIKQKYFKEGELILQMTSH